MSAGVVGEFCSWAAPLALSLALLSAAVLAAAIYGENRPKALLAAPLFVVFSFVVAGCFWGVLDG